MKIFVVFLLLFSVAVVQAQGRKAAPKCVRVEKLIVLRSSNSVHYSEKDEGRVVGRVLAWECGRNADSSKVTEVPAVIPPRPCPPSVQDCIKP